MGSIGCRGSRVVGRALHSTSAFFLFYPSLLVGLGRVLFSKNNFSSAGTDVDCFHAVFILESTEGDAALKMSQTVLAKLLSSIHSVSDLHTLIVL